MLECINTIENIYTNVYIAIKNGDTQIEDYLKSNPNIFVYNISTDVFESDNGYILDFTCKFNSIVLFCGEYKHRKVVDKDGYHVAACFVSSNGKEYSFLQGHDLDEFVIPYLRSNNIKVIKCYAPDLERIPNKKLIFFMTRVWRVVRRCFPSTFNYLRHLVRGTRHLIDDQKGLTNDMSRGYSLMYGNGKYINFDDGFRRTIRDDDVQPDGNVFVFGPCFIRGLGNEDGNTLPSLLQRKIPYKKVYNYGSEFQTVNLIMRLPEYNPGDVAVVFDINTFSDRNTAMYDGYYDMTESYQKVPHVWKHVFDDIMHYDYAVHNMIAEDLSTVVCSTLSDINKDEFDHSSVIFGAGVKKAADLRLFSEDELLIHWLDNVDGIVPYHHESRGAIVMNCNPFTNGHRYLIDYARKKVDTLIVFVLQEERSFFSFQDRIKLVKEGTRDFDNVYVVPSGSFIISSQTLPGYFEKKELSDTVVDLSKDLYLFVKIAQTLHITIRFAGEEPLDPFTSRYNKKMEEYLPRYGIRFDAIQRLSQGEKVVSASRVRSCIGEGKLSEIHDIVPESTYLFIKEHFFI